MTVSSLQDRAAGLLLPLMNNADWIMVGVACIAFACAGFIVCCCALTALNAPPRQNRRAHRLAKCLEWSGSVRLMK